MIVFNRLFNYIQPANQLTRGSDYSLFKEDIKPSWEDPINANGGRWILTMQKKSFDEKTNIDKYWLETVSNYFTFSVHFYFYQKSLPCILLHHVHHVGTNIK